MDWEWEKRRENATADEIIRTKHAPRNKSASPVSKRKSPGGITRLRGWSACLVVSGYVPPHVLHSKASFLSRLSLPLVHHVQ